jgi:hypothetical protein
MRDLGKTLDSLWYDLALCGYEDTNPESQTVGNQHLCQSY